MMGSDSFCTLSACSFANKLIYFQRIFKTFPTVHFQFDSNHCTQLHFLCPSPVSLLNLPIHIFFTIYQLKPGPTCRAQGQSVFLHLSFSKPQYSCYYLPYLQSPTRRLYIALPSWFSRVNHISSVLTSLAFLACTTNGFQVPVRTLSTCSQCQSPLTSH